MTKMAFAVSESLSGDIQCLWACVPTHGAEDRGLLMSMAVHKIPLQYRMTGCLNASLTGVEK